MRLNEGLFRYVYFPLAGGLAELAADGLLPSSQGNTNVVEEVAEGFLAVEAGVILGTVLYRTIAQRTGRTVNSAEESGFAILGGVVGLIGMTAAGLALHNQLGVSDIRWMP